MSELILQHWTGIVGIGMFALTMVEITLYFVYSGPSPVWNIQTRVFLNMFICTGLLAFSVGFQHIILQAHPDYEWLGMLCLVMGLAYALLIFVADSIQVGSVLAKKERIDPTLIGSGAEG